MRPRINTYQSLHTEQSSPFFMTNILDPKYECQTENPTNIGYNLEEHFQKTAKTLEHRRQTLYRQTRRMKQIEEEFEERQSLKNRQLSQKLSSCDKIKQKSMNKIKERLKKIQQQRNKVTSKVRLKELQTLNQQYRQRKAFQNDNNMKSSNNSVKSNSSSSSHQRIKQVAKQIKIEWSKIDDKLVDYSDKLRQAQDVNQLYRVQRSLRARSHNSIAVSEVKKRANQLLNDQIKAESKEAIGHLQSISSVRRNKEKQELKERNHKKKSNSQKLHRLHRNILNLEQTHKQKCHELDQKFAKTHLPQWRDPRATTHAQKLTENLTAIQRSQKIRSDLIIEKHKQISQRNKMIKERRHQLYFDHKMQNQSIL